MSKASGKVKKKKKKNLFLYKCNFIGHVYLDRAAGGGTCSVSAPELEVDVPGNTLGWSWSRAGALATRHRLWHRGKGTFPLGCHLLPRPPQLGL